MPASHQQKLFERFYRVLSEKDKTYPGLGIGLYIAREIIQRLKSEEQTRHIPVILLSAHAGLRETAEKCGANDFLVKPFRLTELREMLKKQLSLACMSPFSP